MKFDPKNRQQLLIVAVLALVGYFVAEKMIFVPLLESWRARSKTIADLRQQVTRGKRTVAAEKATAQEWNDKRKNTLPANKSAAEQQLLAAFDRWSQNARISVSGVKPLWKRGATDDYSVLECRVDAAGSMSSVARFLYEVESSPMALKIESLEIAARDTTGSQLALGLTVTGLRLQPLEGK